MFSKFRLLIATVAVCTMPLLTSACDHFPTQITVPTTSLCSHTAADEKALYGIEATFNVVAQAYVSADQHGLMSTSLKASLKPQMQVAYKYLKGARAAYDICDTATFTSYQSALDTLNKQILPLIPHS